MSPERVAQPALPSSLTPSADSSQRNPVLSAPFVALARISPAVATDRETVRREGEGQFTVAGVSMEYENRPQTLFIVLMGCQNVATPCM